MLKIKMKHAIIAVGFLVTGLLVGKYSSAYKHRELVIDWNKLNVPSDNTIDSFSSMTNTIISLKEFIEIKKVEKRNSLDDIREALPNYVYTNLVKGIESKYFEDYLKLKYKESYKLLQNMLNEALHINKLYETKEDINYTEEIITGNSSVIDFINTYSDDSIKDLLLNSYFKLESMIKREASNTNYVSEELVEMMYQEYLSKDYDSLEYIDIIVETKPLNISNITDNSLIDYINNKNKRLITLDNIKVLKQMELYKTYKYYNGLDTKAKNSRDLITLTSDGEKINSITTIYRLGGGLDPQDGYIITFEVLEANHNGVKEKESMLDELEWQAKVYMANDKISRELIEIMKSTDTENK